MTGSGHQPLKRHQPRPAAYSLIEVVMASTICAIALVPALSLLRDGLAMTRQLDSRNMLMVYGVSKLEEQLALTGATWTTGTLTGDYSSEGHGNVRYTVTRSDDPADGGIVNRLMAVTVTSYDDENGNDVLDTGEPRTVFSTKIGKFVTYEAEAGS